MSNVIDFPGRKAESDDESYVTVWRCNCGCLTFYALATGEIQCADCGIVTSESEGDWRTRLPEVLDIVEPVGIGDSAIRDLDAPDISLIRTLDLASADDTSFVVVAQKDGKTAIWGDCAETDEQKNWFERRIDEAKRMLFK